MSRIQRRRANGGISSSAGMCLWAEGMIFETEWYQTARNLPNTYTKKTQPISKPVLKLTGFVYCELGYWPTLLLQISFSLFHFSDPLQLPLLAVFVNALQIPSQVCEHIIWPVQINPDDLYYHCRFYFRIFTYYLLQVPLFNHRWGHSLVSFGPHYWY